MLNYAVIPSNKTSDSALESYNGVLAFNSMINYGDFTVCLDNHALYSLSNKISKTKSPTYSDINNLIAIAMSGVTCSFRFKSQVNTDLRKLCTNMIHFPRMHFLIAGIAPVGNSSALSEAELT